MVKFTTRDVMWLMLVLAVALSWFVHQRKLRDAVTAARLDAVIWEDRALTAEEELAPYVRETWLKIRK